jgi:hypothetical protein
LKCFDDKRKKFKPYSALHLGYNGRVTLINPVNVLFNRGNPLGKNPGDVWVFPNVKNNHVEKTVHPCQFPVELVDRLVLSLTDKNDWVLDPFLGVGTTVASAVLRGRRGCGSEKMKEYVEIARERVQKAIDGVLPVRPMNTPVYDPANAGKSLTHNSWTLVDDKDSWNQINLVEEVRVAGWSKSEDC